MMKRRKSIKLTILKLAGIMSFLTLFLFILSTVPLESQNSPYDFTVYFIGQNRKQLNTMNVYSKGYNTILKTKERLSKYVFSPNGRYILILTKKEVYIYDRKTQKANLVDSLDRGHLWDAGWSPTGEGFFYLSLNYPNGWQLFLNNIEGKKRTIFEGGIERVFFDPNGNSLYLFESYKIVNIEHPMRNVKV